jgi:CBS domain-containing protein
MDVSRVASVMTPFPYSVDEREDLRTAGAIMKQHGIRHLPVMRDNTLVGLVSQRELDVALAVIGDDPKIPLLVWAVCRQDPYVVELDEPMVEVAETMANRHLDSVLVTRQGKLAGILTTVDICRAFAEAIRTQSIPDVPA